MRDGRRLLLAASPWLAVGVLAWRQRKLEIDLAGFVESAHKALDAAIQGLTAQAQQVMADAVDRQASQN